MRLTQKTVLVSVVICLVIFTVIIVNIIHVGTFLNRFSPNLASNFNITSGRQREVTQFWTNVTEKKLHKNGQQTIPKIIHQIWNDDIIPTEFVKNIQGLVKDNPPPKWVYYFWTKEAALKFVKTYYPFLYEKTKLGSDIMRADILRTLVIHKYGGVYFDLDTISVKPLDTFVDSRQCSMALEPGEHYGNGDFVLTNGALFCIRNHPFYAQFIALMDRMNINCTYVFTCTGPLVWSKLYRDLNRTSTHTEELPRIESSELFQDVYDYKVQDRNLEKKCSGKQALKPSEEKICKTWISRGKKNRTLSDKAYTYHVWYHVMFNKVHSNQVNRIKTIVPHAKIYGIDF